MDQADCSVQRFVPAAVSQARSRMRSSRQGIYSQQHVLHHQQQQHHHHQQQQFVGNLLTMYCLGLLHLQ